MAIFEELRRRNVFKVAFSYLIVAWLLMQVAETLAPALRLPEWFQSGVAFLLIIGFPVALFFAWAYELTPEGLQKDQGPGSESRTARGGGLNRLILVLLAVALAYFVYDEFVVEPAAEQESVLAEADQAPVAGEKSIAVLPFVDMSPEQDQEYMSDGIAEELLNLLAKVPDLEVTSRSSAFSFKGKDIDIPTVARQLKVAYILEGSVRKAGNQLRITTQLIATDSDTHLWSETYDRTLEDVFAIQDEIAAAVVDALKITLLGDLPQSRVVDGAAYDLALEARYFWNRRAPGDVERALELYRQALEIQPDYALAWTGISVALAVQALSGDIPREEGLARARTAAEKALELDPNLAEAHVRMAQAQTRAREPKAALRSLQRALELEPDNVLALGVMGLSLRSAGRIDEAIELMQRTLELDPLGAIWPGNLASLLIQAGRFDEAEDALQRTRELNPAAVIEPDLALIALQRDDAQRALELLEGVPEDEVDPGLQVAVYEELGMHEKADAFFQRYLAGDDPNKSFYLPGMHAARGELEQAFEALENLAPALIGRRGSVEYNVILRRYLADDPRWPAYLDRLGTVY